MEFWREDARLIEDDKPEAGFWRDDARPIEEDPAGPGFWREDARLIEDDKPEAGFWREDARPIETARVPDEGGGSAEPVRSGGFGMDDYAPEAALNTVVQTATFIPRAVSGVMKTGGVLGSAVGTLSARRDPDVRAMYKDLAADLGVSSGFLGRLPDTEISRLVSDKGYRERRRSELSEGSGGIGAMVYEAGGGTETNLPDEILGGAVDWDPRPRKDRALDEWRQEAWTGARQNTQELMNWLAPENTTLDKLGRFFDWFGELSDDARAHYLTAAREKGGLAGQLTAEVFDGIEETVRTLGAFKAIGAPYGSVKGTAGQVLSGPQILANAGARAALSTAMRGYDNPEQIGSALALGFAYQATPALSGMADKDLKAALYDVGLNAGITTTTDLDGMWERSTQRAEMDGGGSAVPYMLAEMGMAYGSDFIFGIQTKSRVKDQARARAAEALRDIGARAEQLKSEADKVKEEGVSRDEETPVALPRDVEGREVERVDTPEEREEISRVDETPVALPRDVEGREIERVETPEEREEISRAAADRLNEKIEKGEINDESIRGLVYHDNADTGSKYAPVTFEAPVKLIQHSAEVPQFKRDADKRGVVKGQELAGELDRRGMAPIVLWKRLDGRLEVITGRHRLDLAQRTGEDTIPAHVLKESDGFTADMARAFDAESNIKDEKGSVLDYANYFRSAGERFAGADGEREAAKRGLLARDKGRRGWILGTLGSDNLWSYYAFERTTLPDGRVIEGRLSENKALAIAKGAPNDDALQAVGIKLAVDNKGLSAEEIEESLRVMKFNRDMLGQSSGRAEQLTLFGEDDPLIANYLKIGKEAAKVKSNIRREIDVLKGGRKAHKFADIAKKYGIHADRPEDIDRQISELEQALAEWSNWEKDREKISDLAKLAGINPAEVIPNTKETVAEPADPIQRLQERAQSMEWQNKAVGTARDAALKDRADAASELVSGLRKGDRVERDGEVWVVTDNGKAGITLIREGETDINKASVMKRREFAGEFIPDRQGATMTRLSPLPKEEPRPEAKPKEGDAVRPDEAQAAGEPIQWEELRRRLVRDRGPRAALDFDKMRGQHGVETAVDWARQELAKQQDLIPGKDMPFNLAGERVDTGRADIGDDIGEVRRGVPDERTPDMFGERGVMGDAAPNDVAGGWPGPDLQKPLERETRSGLRPEDDNRWTRLPFELPEAVRFGEELLGGQHIHVLKKLRLLKGKALGLFRYGEGEGATGEIELRADIFARVQPEEKKLLENKAWEYAAKLAEDQSEKKVNIRKIAREKYKSDLQDLLDKRSKENPLLASKVIWHEIGHVADWLSDKTFAKGNILGHIAGIYKYMKHQLASSPEDQFIDGPFRPLSAADKQKIRRQVEKDILSKEIVDEIIIQEPVYRELGITPEQVTAVWRDNEAREKYPDLYMAVARLNTADKKRVMKAALKGMVDEILAGISGREQIGVREVRRQVRRMPEINDVMLKEEFAKALKREMEARGVVTRDDIITELRPLIQWWRGMEDWNGYFENPAEMYAEAFSVLMNNPAALAARAPKFWAAWNGWVENRADVKGLLEKFENDIKSGQIYKDRVEDLRAGFDRMDKKSIVRQEQARRLGKGEVRDRISYSVDRIFGPVYRRVWGVLDMPKTAEQGRVIKSIEDYLYKGAEHELLLARVNKEVGGLLVERGLTWTDFGEYLFHQHVIHNRADYASPRGFNLNASSERLAEMREQYGPTGYKALEAAGERFRAIYDDMVVRLLDESGVLDDELMATIKERLYYATMSVVKGGEDTSLQSAFESNFGSATGSRIYRQIGTVKHVQNPATATTQKALSLISMVYREEAKRSVVEWMLKHNSDEIRPARTRWTGRRNETIYRDDERIGTIEFLDRGKTRAYYVPKAVAQAFERTTAIEGQLAVLATKTLTNPLKLVYTQGNYGFWPVNFVRDMWDYVRKVPGASLFFGTGAYWKYHRQAWKSARSTITGELDANAEAALKRKMLISLADPMGMTLEDQAFERMLVRYHQTPVMWEKQNLRAVDQIKKAWNKYMELGQTMERTVKIAGMLYLDTNKATMPEWQKQQIVHNFAGSPNFLQKGAGNPLLDFFMLFYNPFKEGLRSEVQAFKMNKAEYTLKTVQYTILPKLGMGFLAAGGLALLAGRDPEDDPIREMYDAMSEYDKTNYFCIPLGWINKEQRKVAYIRLPMSEAQRFTGGLVWKGMQAARGRGVSGEGILSFAGGQLPSGNPINPLSPGSVPGAWIQYGLFGQNPYDAFRGRGVLRDDVYQAGGGRAYKALGMWSANQLGGGLLARFDEWGVEDQSKLEKFLAAPVISNLLGRWIKVSDRGAYDRMRGVVKDTRQRRAKQRLDVQDIMSDMRRGKELTPDQTRILSDSPYQSKYFGARIKRESTRALSPFARQIIGAQSKEEGIEILRALSPRERETTLQELNVVGW